MNEKQKLTKAVNEFSEAMIKKLRFKSEHGRRGWNDPANIGAIELALLKALRNQIRSGGQEVDIANYAMMLYFLHKEQLDIPKFLRR